MKLYFLLVIYCSYVRCNVVNTGFFWQVTDFHYDANYSAAGDPKAMCHQGNSGNHVNSVFGNYLCDSPMKLIVSAITAMKTFRPNPDFIFWTGDSVPHVKDSELNEMKIYYNVGNVTDQLLKAFPSTPIYPVLGNHDEYPKDAFPAVNTTYYSNILSVSNWSELLHQSEAEQFKVGGYYSTELNTNLVVLGLNTNLYYGFNPLTNHSVDPAGQFSWLESQLKLARQNKQKVMIISHIAPGMFELTSGLMWFKLRFNARYVSILKQYSDVISAQIYGHEHTDSFRILKDNDGNAVGTLFLSPAVTPWKSTLPGVGSNNPGIRLYEYNKLTGEITNYHQYFLNLSKAIETGLDQWEKEYDAIQDFELDSTSPTSFLSAAMSFRQNQQLFKKYLQFNSASQNLNPVCDDKCLKVHICSITELQIAQFNMCLNSPYPTTSSEPPWHSRPHPHPHPHPYHDKPVPRYMVIVICTLAAMVFIAAVVIAIICIKRHTISIPHRYNRFNSQLGKGPIN